MSGPLDLLGSLGGGRPERADVAVTETGAPPCSRRGCRAEAEWALEWNNPRVHTPDRVKTWLACQEHREVLEAFLGERGFLRRTVPLDRLARGPQDDADEDTDR